MALPYYFKYAAHNVAVKFVSLLHDLKRGEER